jgi:hypothetical protein
MLPGEGFGAEQRVAQSARGLLHNVKNVSRVIALGIVFDDVSLRGGSHHTDLIGSGGDLPLHQGL